MIAWMKVLLLIAGFHWSGLCLLHLIAPRGRRMAPELRIPMSFALGVGLHALAQSCALAIAGGVRAELIWLTPVAATLCLLRGGREGADSFFRGFGAPSLLSGADEGPSVRALRRCALLVIALNAGLILNEAVSYPMIGYDERAIWSLKAKILDAEGSVNGAAFNDPLRVHYHPDYPLLVPLTGFALYATLGGPDERLARFVFFWFFLCTALFLGGTVSDRAGPDGGPLAGAAAMLLFVSLSSVYGREEEGLISSAADIPLSFFALLAVTNLASGDPKSFGQRTLAGVFLACALMTKNEGMVLFAAAAVVMIAGSMIRTTGDDAAWTRRIAPGAAAVGVALLAALPSIHVRSSMPNFYDEDFGSMIRPENFAGAAARIPLVISSFVSEVTATSRWNLVWVLWPLSLILSLSRAGRGRHLPADLILVVWITGYLAIYCFTPLHIDFHLKTSLFRLMAHPLPLAIAGLCIAGARLAGARGRFGEGSESGGAVGIDS